MKKTSLAACLMLCLLIFMVTPAQAQSSKKAIEQVLTLYPELKATGPPTPKPAGPILRYGDKCTTSTRCETDCCDPIYNKCLQKSQVLPSGNTCLP